MKIVQIITTLCYGGAEKICIDLSNALVKHPSVSKVVIISLHAHNSGYRPLNTIDPNIELHFLNKKGNIGIPVFLKLYRLLKKLKPDVIHTHLTGLVYALPFVLTNKRISVIHTIHNIPSKDVPGLFQPVHKWLFRSKLVHPVAISKQIQEAAQLFYTISKMELVYNFIAAPQTTSALNEVRDKIESLKETRHTKVFLNIGRLNQQKNQIPLIEVFAKKDEDIILVILGGYKEAGTYGEKVKAIADQAANVYMMGNVPNPIDYLVCADFFILSSLYEGLPVSLIEAAAMGIVPIATDVGGVNEIISDGKSGILIKSTNPAAIYKGIIDGLALDESTKIEMRFNLNALYQQHFSIQNAVELYLQVYNA